MVLSLPTISSDKSWLKEFFKKTVFKTLPKLKELMVNTIGHAKLFHSITVCYNFYCYIL